MAQIKKLSRIPGLSDNLDLITEVNGRYARVFTISNDGEFTCYWRGYINCVLPRRPDPRQFWVSDKAVEVYD